MYTSLTQASAVLSLPLFCSTSSSISKLPHCVFLYCCVEVACAGLGAIQALSLHYACNSRDDHEDEDISRELNSGMTMSLKDSEIERGKECRGSIFEFSIQLNSPYLILIANLKHGRIPGAQACPYTLRTTDSLDVVP